MEAIAISPQIHLHLGRQRDESHFCRLIWETSSQIDPGSELRNLSEFNILLNEDFR